MSVAFFNASEQPIQGSIGANYKNKKTPAIQESAS